MSALGNRDGQGMAVAVDLAGREAGAGGCVPTGRVDAARNHTTRNDPVTHRLQGSSPGLLHLARKTVSLGNHGYAIMDWVTV